MKIYARNLIKTYLRLCFAVHNADQHRLMPFAGEDNGTLHGDFWWVCVCRCVGVCVCGLGKLRN